MSKTGVWATAADSSRLLRVSPITAYCTLTVIVFQWAYKLSRGETMCPADRGGSTSVRGRIRSPHSSGGEGPDLQNILRLSYDNAIVTIDLRRTTNLPNRLTKGGRLFLGMIHLQNCKIVGDSVRKLAYHIPKKVLARFKSLS